MLLHDVNQIKARQRRSCLMSNFTQSEAADAPIEKSSRKNENKFYIYSSTCVMKKNFNEEENYPRGIMG